ncbi:MAG: DUF1449 family protein [Azoarcus sp.]|jgi:hypothetical protein|nr:DUF1449 family protein [Azoarcus sp.]
MTLLEILTGYPTAIYTVLLGIVLVYWLLAILGLVDFESTDFGLDLGDAGGEVDLGDVSHGSHTLDGEADGELTSLAGRLVAFGLGGVPISVVVSLLVLVSWFICAFASLRIMPLVPGETLRLAAGTGILVAAFALALPLAAICVRPLRGLFVKTNAISNASLVGRECRIETGSVDEKFGHAVVWGGGEEFHIRVVADTPNTLKRHDTALIVDYDEAARVYRVAAKL